MDAINAKQLELAMDVAAQRFLAVQVAAQKTNGGWDKAQKLELIGNPNDTVQAHGLQRLTQS